MSCHPGSKDDVALDVGLDVSAQDVGPMAGRLGLQNMGNTCFMNTGLQCIAHLEPLAQYFLRGGFEADSPVKASPAKSSASGDGDAESKAELTRSFSALMRELWQCGAKKPNQKRKSVLPKHFYNTFKQLQPFLFEDEQQQDVQEFIGFCLEGLNTELNRVSEMPSKPSDAQIKHDERLCDKEGDDFAAAFSWHRHLEREKSFLVDLLQGQSRSSVTCQKCGYVSRKFEPFMHLSIPVEKNMNCLTDAICKFMEEEELSGDEQWFCEKCKAKVDAKKKIDLWFLPPVLILHLKRFDSSLTKIDKRLHMPVYGFDLAKCCSKTQKDGAVYDIACVANHQGAYGSGHYTAICRVGPPSSGTWHMYDDDQVSELKDSRSVATKQAYVVFLVRQGRDDLVASSSKKRPEALPEPKARTLLRQRMLPRCQSITHPDDWPHASQDANKAREAASQDGCDGQASKPQTAQGNKGSADNDMEKSPDAKTPASKSRKEAKTPASKSGRNLETPAAKSVNDVKTPASKSRADVKTPASKSGSKAVSSTPASGKNSRSASVAEEDSSEGNKCSGDAVPAALCDVATPSRKGRSANAGSTTTSNDGAAVNDETGAAVNDDTGQPPLKKQRSMFDYFSSMIRSSSDEVKPSLPKQQTSLLHFWKKP